MMQTFWESCSHASIELVMKADKLARKTGGRTIYFEHLLAALLDISNVKKSFECTSVNAERLKDAVIGNFRKRRELAVEEQHIEIDNLISFSDGVTKILSNAQKLANHNSLQFSKIYPEHIFISLLQSNDEIAVEFLASQSICAEAVLQALIIPVRPLPNFAVELFAAALATARRMNAIVLEPVHFLVALFHLNPQVIELLETNASLSQEQLETRTKLVLSHPLLPIQHFSLGALTLLAQLLKLEPLAENSGLRALLIILRSGDLGIKQIFEEQTQVSVASAIRKINGILCD